MASKINYNTKAPFQTREDIPNENKVNAEDMNEIKEVVNSNADELDTAKENIESLQNGQGTSNADITSLKNRVITLEGDNTTNKADISSLKTDNETNKSDIEELQQDNETNKTNITNLQNNKVDKAEGKGLSTEDFTTELKTKLEGLENYNDAEIKQDIIELEGKVSTLEEDNTTNKTNIETLQEDNIQNKQDISDLKESQAKQNEVLNDVIFNLFPTETQEDESINIKGTIPVKFKEFKVSGNSKQETRSGKNMINVLKDTLTTEGITFTNNGDGTVTINGTATNAAFFSMSEQTFTIENGKTYSLYLGGTTNGLNMVVRRKSINKQLIILSNAQETATTTYNDETVDDAYAYIRVENGTILNNVTVYPMLVEGSELGAYEPYGAMPSPEFKSDIRNVGDNVNEFDISKITNTNKITNNGDGTLTLSNNSNGVGAASTEKTLKQLCPNLKIGDVVTLSFKTTTQNSEYKNSIYIDKYWNNKETITITEEDLNANVTIYGGYQETSKISEIKIEKGTKASDYSPYNCGNVNVSVCNKNLINWNKVIEDSINTSKTDDGYIKFYQGADRLIIKDIFKENVQYAFNIVAKKDVQGKNVAFNIFYTDGTSDNLIIDCPNANTDYSQIFITQQGKKLDYIRSYFSDSTASYIKIEGTQIEKGSTATDYVPHQKQNVLFPLAENQKLMLGDYLAEDGIHHKRKQVELDGTENILILNWTTPHTKTTIFNVLNVIDKKVDIVKFCNYFKVVKNTSGNINKDEEYCFNDITGGVYFSISNDIASTIEKFKAWLASQKEAGTPVIVEYELAEEEIEAYTPEQQEAYNQICSLKAYEEETNIYSENEISPIFKVTAIKDFNTIITQLNSVLLERS